MKESQNKASEMVKTTHNLQNLNELKKDAANQQLNMQRRIIGGNVVIQ